MAATKIIKRMVNSIGLEAVKTSTFNELVLDRQKLRELSSSVQFLKNISHEESLKRSLMIADLAKAQINQDVFALVMSEFKKDGYFVEFGATNGIHFSNSWLLENEFKWQGILAEPGRSWQKLLHKNRECKISNKCVWKESNEQLIFNEAVDGGFSTIDSLSQSDDHYEVRMGGTKYEVETISLNDLLTSFNAPKVIDYLSIDTEGSEYDILSTFDFQKWYVSIITVEHNFTERREKIKSLLEANGYTRVLEQLSQFDDWYVKSDMVDDVEKRFNVK